ncbi:hydroxypyruvate isomerase family protein [Bacterioplanoides pacificum]|uniref:Hydroxypyruvate isomerase family protein n=1 Tax=Bacterioplanoides pacificum TaxID=1171596 RepID=A0ABV7VV42_9GAMM
MKLSANLSLLYPELPFLQRFAAARADGFRAVEIQFPYDTPIADIRRALDDHGLRCVLINVPAGDLMLGGEGLAAVPGKQAEYAAALVECLAYARALQVQCVNVLPGRCSDENQKVFYLDTFKKNLAKTAQSLAPFGITTTFEAINTRDMPGFLIAFSQQMFDIVRELNMPSVRAQYDVYHMAMMGEDVCDVITRYADQIGHIQFADTPQRGEPGTGMLDFKSIFRAIETSRYQGWVGAEYKPSNKTSQTLEWKNKLASAVAECS